MYYNKYCYNKQQPIHHALSPRFTFPILSSARGCDYMPFHQFSPEVGGASQMASIRYTAAVYAISEVMFTAAVIWLPSGL